MEDKKVLSDDELEEVSGGKIYQGDDHDFQLSMHKTMPIIGINPLITDPITDPKEGR